MNSSTKKQYIYIYLYTYIDTIIYIYIWIPSCRRHCPWRSTQVRLHRKYTVFSLAIDCILPHAVAPCLEVLRLFRRATHTHKHKNINTKTHKLTLPFPHRLQKNAIHMVYREIRMFLLGIRASYFRARVWSSPQESKKFNHPKGP